MSVEIENAIRILTLVALIDDNFSESEELLITKICHFYNIPIKKFDEIYLELQNSNENRFDMCEKLVDQIKDNRLKEDLIKNLSSLIASDHIIHENELLVYKLIAQKWNMFREEAL